MKEAIFPSITSPPTNGSQEDIPGTTWGNLASERMTPFRFLETIMGTGVWKEQSITGRPTAGLSSGQADPIQIGWGGLECIPFSGYYDGDGTTDMMLYHAPANQWFVYGIGNIARLSGFAGFSSRKSF